MRRPLGLLGLLAALVAVVLAADIWLAAEAERRASARVSAALGAPATVDLQGWPVGLRLALGSVARAQVVAVEVPLEGTDARLSRLHVTLTGLRVALRDLDPAAPAVDVRAAAGRFTADLEAEAVRALLRLPERLRLVDVELAAGQVRLELAGYPVVGATVTVDAGGLLLSPAGPLLERVAFRIDAPELPAGARIEQVQVLPGVLRVSGSVARLDLAPAG